MKAIINVNPKSSYSYLNGLTLKVKKIGNKTITLLICSDEVDFSLNEIFIVDINKEIQLAYDNDKWGSDTLTYARLVNYCDIKNINYEKPTYNCPA